MGYGNNEHIIVQPDQELKQEVDNLNTEMVNKAPKKKTDTWIDVIEDFGAKGNGTADDTIAIQNAIDAASSQGGGIVFIPNGTFMCANIQLKSNVSIIGSGEESILKLLPNAHTRSINGSIVDNNGNYPSNVLATTLTHTGGIYYNPDRALDENNSEYIASYFTISNLKIDGNKEQNQLGDMGENASAMGACIALNQASHVTIQNVTCANARLDGVMLGYSLHGGSDYCTVIDCYFENNDRTGIAQVTGKYNSFINCKITHDGNVAGLDIEANLAGEINFGHLVTGCYVEGEIANISKDGAKQQNCRIINNQVIGGIVVGASDSTGGTLIQGNQLRGNGEGSVLTLGGSNYGADGTYFSPVKFIGNTAIGFKDIIPDLIQGGHGHIIVEDNYFEVQTGFILQRGYKIVIHNNHIKFSGGDGTVPAIQYAFNNTDAIPNQGEITISKNVLSGDGVSALLVGSSGVNPPVITEKELVSFIENIIDITYTNATVIDPFGTIVIKGNRINHMGTINCVDWLQIEDNEFIFTAPTEGLLYAVSTFKYPRVCGNIVRGGDLTPIRPQNGLFKNNIVIDGKFYVVYSFTEVGAGGNIYEGNTMISTKQTLPEAFNITTANGFLAEDFVEPDVIVGNSHRGLYNTGSYLAPDAPKWVQGNTFDNHVMLGTYQLWVDATGNLRMKNGIPTSDTDGTIVGTQS